MPRPSTRPGRASNWRPWATRRRCRRWPRCLADEKLASHARSALESIADPGAAAALREALGRLHGELLVGAINSLGGPPRRPGGDRDGEAGRRPLRRGVAEAAWAALGRIATPEAVQCLAAGAGGNSADSKVHTTAEIRAAAAHASLACAQQLLIQGKRPEAIALLDQVRGADLPKHVRASATYDAILARQSADLSLFTAQLKAGTARCSPWRFVPAGGWRAPKLPGAAGRTGAIPPPRQVLVIGVLGERDDAAVLSVLRKAADSGPVELRAAALKAMGQLR